jgi:hypothetical protein
MDLAAHWQAADGLARRLGLGEEVRQSLRETPAAVAPLAAAVRDGHHHLRAVAVLIGALDAFPRP